MGIPALPRHLAATTTSRQHRLLFLLENLTLSDTPASSRAQYLYLPASTNPLVYVVAKGGNTQNNGNPSQTNSAAAFVALYGTCTDLSSSNFVYLSEVTTTATMAALQQFFNPVAETFSADGTGQQSIIVSNISNTIALLADSVHGSWRRFYSPRAPRTSNRESQRQYQSRRFAVTATPEASKLNLIANDSLGLH